MTAVRAFTLCLAGSVLACASGRAGDRNGDLIDRLEEARTSKPPGADAAVEEPADPPEEPMLDARAPSGDWLMARDAVVNVTAPPAKILLVNPEADAQVVIVLFPSELGTIREMISGQREAFVKAKFDCSAPAVAKDGSWAAFRTSYTTSSGVKRKGKIAFLRRAQRREHTIAVFASWKAEADKAMLADVGKVIVSITIK
jgi:hypothetical protein